MGSQLAVEEGLSAEQRDVVAQDTAIVGRTPLAVPATFTVSPTGTYVDMHVVTA